MLRRSTAGLGTLVAVAIMGLAVSAQAEGVWKAGFAQATITPPRPVVLLGYGDRAGPFTSVVADLHAKALALEDTRGQRAVIVTADLVGFQAAVVTDEVCRRITAKTGLPRSQLLFNASHTHTGPLVSLAPHATANAAAHPPLTDNDVRETVAYTRALQEQLVQAVCDALASLAPAHLAWGVGRVEFPMNRRLPQGGRIVMSDNPQGPTDRGAPVLRIDSLDGRPRGVLFGCACHNATLTGRDNVIAGDCFGYLPSAQIVREGGHEAIGITLWIWGADDNVSSRVGFFAPEVEQVVWNTVGELVMQAGRPVRQWLSTVANLPSGLVFPEAEWQRATPEEAGLDAEKLREVLARANVTGGSWGGVPIGEHDWGAVLTRGGRLVEHWGNPRFKQPSASLGKCLVRALFGITIEAGLIQPDEPIAKTWTGRGELSHSHKYLDAGEHRTLTWRQLLEHQGGFVLESGYHWRNRTQFHEQLPEGVRWTGDPLADNYAHTSPGAITRYSSGGYVRLGQALTAVWNRDLKEVLDERLFGPLGIPPDRWDWLTAKQVHETQDFYPDFPGYGEYVDPPYSIHGHVDGWSGANGCAATPAWRSTSWPAIRTPW
jgi:CubicO group peptidase (beta-lactamase class C family)